MAFGLRYWVGALGVGCAAATALALPLSDDFSGTVVGTELDEMRRGYAAMGLLTPEREHYLALGQELQATSEALRRIRWVEAATALSRGAADRTVPLVVGVPEQRHDGGEFDPAAVEALATRVAEELRVIGAPRPAAALGVFLVSSSSERGTVTDRYLTALSNRVEWYAGTRDGRPYCITLRASARPTEEDLTTYSWRAAGPLERTEILGPCGFYARYGMPSATIQRWMQGPGGALAAEREEGERVMPENPEPKLYFGRRADIEVAGLVFEGCMVGRAATCEAILLEEHSERYDRAEAYEPAIMAAGVPLLDGRPTARNTGLLAQVASARLLDQLEEQFGSEAFAEFWHSDLPVADAFTAAFGVTPADWGREWTRSVYGEAARAAVLPGLGESALGLFYVAIAVFAVSWFVRERRLV
jgi:hypothetical protein